MIFDSLNEDELTFRIHYQNILATLFFKMLRKVKNVVKFHSYIRDEVLKEEKEDNSKKEEELVMKINRLTEKITSRPDKPKPAISPCPRLHSPSPRVQDSENVFMPVLSSNIHAEYFCLKIVAAKP